MAALSLCYFLSYLRIIFVKRWIVIKFVFKLINCKKKVTSSIGKFVEVIIITNYDEI